MDEHTGTKIHDIHTLHDIHAYDWIRERIDQYRGYPPTGFK